MKKQVFAALILVVFTLTACGGGSGGQTPQEGAAQPQAGAAQPQESAAQPEESAAEPQGDGSLERVLAAGKLTIGCEGNWVPYVFNEGGTGELVGFEVEIAKEIAKRLGVEAEFNVASQWDGVIAGLDAKRYDTVICGVSPKPDRQEQYYLSVPYAENPICLVTAADNTEITSFEDLKGKLCANSLTSSSGDIARKYGAELANSDMAQAMDLLATGRADGHVNNLMAIVDYLKEKPDSPVAVAAIYEPESSWEIESAAMFRQEDVELGNRVDEILAEMIADGTCYSLAEKYFGKEVADSISIYK